MLPAIAANRLAQWRATRALASTEPTPLLDFVQQIAPYFERFEYFAPYAAELERAIGGNLRLAVAAPPQHGKTEFSLRAFLWWDRFFPGRRHVYVTFNENRTREVAKDFLRIAREAGFDPQGTLAKVVLRGGSTIKFTSVNGDLTGSPIDGVGLIDDPIKGPEQARSPTIRGNAINWWKSVARTRRHPGTSYIAMATRWHVDDLSGYLLRAEGWKYLNFKAISEARDTNDIDVEGRIVSDPLRRRPGEALCPSRKPVEYFREERTDAYWWAAQFQGEPRPLGGAIFAEPARYEELPTKGYRVAYGVDLAFSKRTHADFSVCLRLIQVRDPANPDPKTNATYYVDVVHRKQVQAPEFLLTLKACQVDQRGPMLWYASGPEMGSGDFIKKHVPQLKVKPPYADKLGRAQAVAAAWNAGRVLVPDPRDDEDRRHPWLDTFLDEMQNFTGVDDLHDDQVDALAAAFDLLSKKTSSGDDDSGGLVTFTRGD